MSAAIHLLVVSADPLARAALATLLQDDTDIRLVDVTSPQVLEQTTRDDLSEWAVQVIVWDLGLDPGELPAYFFADFELPIVVLLSDPAQAAEALRAGAKGIIPRDMNRTKISGAVAAVNSGLLAIDPAFQTSLSVPLHERPNDLHQSLTPRELEVLQLLAEGLTNRAIASRLAVSEHTIKFHVNGILNKLDAQSRTEAVVLATRLGLIAL